MEIKQVKILLITRGGIIITFNYFIMKISKHTWKQRYRDKLIHSSPKSDSHRYSPVLLQLHFSCAEVFSSFMAFHPQMLYWESHLLEDIFLDDSNPTITLTRLTVTTLISSIIQNTCDFLWLSPYVFHSWFLQPFLQNQEEHKGGFWEADIILFLDFDTWTFLHAILYHNEDIY